MLFSMPLLVLRLQVNKGFLQKIRAVRKCYVFFHVVGNAFHLFIELRHLLH